MDVFPWQGKNLSPLSQEKASSIQIGLLRPALAKITNASLSGHIKIKKGKDISGHTTTDTIPFLALGHNPE